MSINADKDGVILGFSRALPLRDCASSLVDTQPWIVEDDMTAQPSLKGL